MESKVNSVWRVKAKKNKSSLKRNSNALVVVRGNSSELSQINEVRMPVFPSRIRKILRYSESEFALTSTAGAVSTYVFRANDLFDPNFTGTGHQPMGFDQLMVWYNHFSVINCRAFVTFKNTTAGPMTGLVRQDSASGAITVIDRLYELGGCSSVDLEQYTGFGSQKTLDVALSVPKLQGITPAALTADPTLRGDAATSPTEVTYFHVCFFSAAGLTGTCNVSVILEQEAYFMEPRDLTESLVATDMPAKVVYPPHLKTELSKKNYLEALSRKLHR